MVNIYTNLYVLKMPNGIIQSILLRCEPNPNYPLCPRGQVAAFDRDETITNPINRKDPISEIGSCLRR